MSLSPSRYGAQAVSGHPVHLVNPVQIGLLLRFRLSGAFFSNFPTKTPNSPLFPPSFLVFFPIYIKMCTRLERVVGILHLPSPPIILPVRHRADRLFPAILSIL